MMEYEILKQRKKAEGAYNICKHHIIFTLILPRAKDTNILILILFHHHILILVANIRYSFHSDSFFKVKLNLFPVYLLAYCF